MAKQYLSIIRLFEHSGIDYEATINVSRTKKQLNAEFDYAKNGFIELEGYIYNKADVLEELDNPDFLIRLPYHIRLWRNNFILIILEDNIVNLAEIDNAIKEFEEDEVFDKHFLQYFALPFNYISRSFINNKDLESLGDWLRYKDFVASQDTEDAFKPIRIYIDETIITLKNINTENYHIFRDSIKEWIDFGWYKFVNNLPDEFYEPKVDLVINLINLTVKIQRSDKDECKQISNGLVELKDLPRELTETINKNYNVYNSSSTSSSSGLSISYKWIFWVIFVLLKVLVFSKGCN